jgi:hypothetical protein
LIDPTNLEAGSGNASTPSVPLPAPSFSPRPDAAGLRAGRPDRRVLGLPGSRAFAELLIDCEEDRTLRAVLTGMLLGGREAIAARAPTRLI